MCDAGGRRVRLNLAHTSEQSTTSDGTHICVQIAEPPFSGGRWLEFGSRLDASVEFELIDQPGVQRKLLKGDRPAVPVGAVGLGRDRGDQLLPERLAVAVEAVSTMAAHRPKTRDCHGASKTSSPLRRGGAAAPSTSKRSAFTAGPRRSSSLA